MVKGIVIAVILLGLGCAYYLQKQHERKEALALRKRQEEAFAKAHATPAAANSNLKDVRESKPILAPTPMLAPTAKPKPTPMLPKPTPVLGRSP